MKNSTESSELNTSKHKVLLFGWNLVHHLGTSIYYHKNADIDIIPFPEDYGYLKRLSEYTLVITDYAPFNTIRGLHAEEQDVFEKMCSEALDKGTTICFVHYNEDVPTFDKTARSNEYMNVADCRRLEQSQLCFRFLNRLSIQPYIYLTPIVTGKLNRGIFQPFLSKWGASYNYFKCYGDVDFDDVIISIKEYTIGFSMNIGRGRIVVLPFQRDFKREDDFLRGINTLVDCMLTYLVNTQEEIPEWAATPFFLEEKQLHQERLNIEQELNLKNEAIKPFMISKHLLFQAGYKLETAVSDFIQNQIGIKTHRIERFVEDFWMLDESGNRIVICEVKSYVKGFKKSGIYSLYNHREANELENTFPGILFINHHMQAASWKSKDQPIDKQDYMVAAQNNILIIRVEDIVRLWAALKDGLISSASMITMLTTSKGWLKVDSSLSVSQMPR